MSVRRAVARDAEALGAVLSDWIDETPWMPRLHSRDEDRGLVAGLIETCDVWTDTGAQGFLARQDEEVRALYIAAQTRGRGLGHRLLEAAKKGRKALELWTFQENEGAIRFYDREGFREVCRTVGTGNEEKLPDLRMRWEARHGG